MWEPSQVVWLIPLFGGQFVLNGIYSWKQDLSNISQEVHEKGKSKCLSGNLLTTQS